MWNRERGKLIREREKKSDKCEIMRILYISCKTESEKARERESERARETEEPCYQTSKEMREREKQ